MPGSDHGWSIGSSQYPRSAVMLEIGMSNQVNILLHASRTCSGNTLSIEEPPVEFYSLHIIHLLHSSARRTEKKALPVWLAWTLNEWRRSCDATRPLTCGIVEAPWRC